MNKLSEFERQVLASLQIEPGGMSLAELADGLLGDWGPEARGRVKAALTSIARALGQLHIQQGDDALGHANVELYAIRRGDAARVRRFFRS